MTKLFYLKLEAVVFSQSKPIFKPLNASEKQYYVNTIASRTMEIVRVLVSKRILNGE